MLARLIPSMFARRLLLLGLLLVVGCVVPALQVARLTLVRGEELRRDAESRLILERRIPTHRGRILDRKGRVLAIDRPSYDIAADYQVITGRWAFTQAARAARRQAGARWLSLSPDQREALVNQHLPEFEQQLEAMWTQVAFTAGLTRDEIEERKNDIKLQVQTLAATVWDREDRRARSSPQEQDDRLDRARELGSDPDPLPAPGDAAGAPPRRVRTEIEEQSPRFAHVLIRGVDDRTAFAFLRLAGSADAAPLDPAAPPPLPGLRVIDGSVREYPLETVEVNVDRSWFPSPLRSAEPVTVRVAGVATHLIGWMRNRVHAEDQPRRVAELRRRGPAVGDGDDTAESGDLGRYEPGDAVGAAGIEAAAEFDLRGLRGVERRHLDTGVPETIPPRPGADVHLSIDALLQARVQALFEPALGLAVVQPWYSRDMLPSLGRRLCGAAVVLDVDSGEILALATAPTFTREQVRSAPPGFLFPLDEKDPDHPRPGLNRAIAKPYQPGSIVKPLVLCAAVASGHYHPSQRMACTGHFYPTQPGIFRCWIFKQFRTTHSDKLGHDLDGADAVMASCNIFFFELGRRMGPATLADWYTRFGVGPRAVLSSLGLGIRGEDGAERPAMFPGSLGVLGRPPTPSEAILMAIGQGPIAWTPLHAADAYATLARAGLRIPARLRLDSPGVSAPIDLHLDPSAVEQALAGLRRSVTDASAGTTHHITIDGHAGHEPVFNAPGVTVWAKSGTATARIEKGKEDLDHDGRLDDVYTDHAWCVCLAGPADGPDARPRFAIAVVVDEAGSGGKAAGPIANQVIHALIAEGYLPAATGPRSGTVPDS